MRKYSKQWAFAQVLNTTVIEFDSKTGKQQIKIIHLVMLIPVTTVLILIFF